MDESLNIAISLIEALAVLIVGIGAIWLARAIIGIRRSLDKMGETLGSLANDARPALDRARAIGENLNFIAMSVRKEVDRASETISHVNDRLEEVVESAEERVAELTALIDIVQDEVEDTLVTASSALRGIRAGAQLLTTRRHQNDEDEAAEEDEQE